MKHKVPVEKGKSYEIEIRTLGTSGEGVGRYEDFTVFVPGALPGESVQAAIDEVKKTYAKAHLIKVLRASRDRVVPACPIYENPTMSAPSENILTPNGVPQTVTLGRSVTTARMVLMGSHPPSVRVVW